MKPPEVYWNLARQYNAVEHRVNQYQLAINWHGEAPEFAVQYRSERPGRRQGRGPRWYLIEVPSIRLIAANGENASTAAATPDAARGVRNTPAAGGSTALEGAPAQESPCSRRIARSLDPIPPQQSPAAKLGIFSTRQ